MSEGELELHAGIEDIHWWFRARREIILSLLSRHLPPDRNKRIAEIGCGTGGNLKFLGRHYDVMGVDISPVAVEQTRKRAGCPALLGDFREVLEGTWEQIDGIVLADVLEHIEDDATFVKDIIARMKPGSLLLITVPANRLLWSSHDVALGHHRRYSRRGLHALWQGLEAEELFFSPFNFLLAPVIALIRVLKGGKAGAQKSDLSLPPAWLNRLLLRIFSADRILMKHGPLPLGISFIALLRKTGGEGSGHA